MLALRPDVCHVCPIQMGMLEAVLASKLLPHVRAIWELDRRVANNNLAETPEEIDRSIAATPTCCPVPFWRQRRRGCYRPLPLLGNSARSAGPCGIFSLGRGLA